MIGTLCECRQGKVVRIRSTERFCVRGVDLILDGCPIGMCPACGEKYYPAAVLRRARELAQKVRSMKRVARVPLIPYGDRRRAAGS